MRGREVCWIIFLAGLPFSNFLYKGLDLWHGHARWVEIWLPVLVGLSFISPTQRPANRALGVWIAVIGGGTLWLWYSLAAQAKAYPVSLLMPLLHLISGICFVWAAMQTWTKEFLPKLLRWVGYVGMVSLAYGLIQVANLDQFFKPISANIPRDALVGTIGNYNHFAAYLAMLLPIYLWMTGKLKYVFIGVLLLLIFLTRSEAGYLSLGAVCLWEAWHRNRKVFVGLMVLCCLGSMLVFTHDESTLASLHSRLARWGLYWQMVSPQFITGLGIGHVFEYAKVIDQTNDPHHPLWHWRHVHNEYLQILVEQGMIGLAAFGYLLWDIGKSAWKLRENPEARVCTGMLLAILANALFNFPFHLWMISSLGLMAYCGIKVIEAEL